MQDSERTDKPSIESQEGPWPLYLAHFEGLAGINEMLWPVQADILIAGRPAGDQTFWVHEIRRFSLRSEPLDELGGPLSLAGPVGGAEIEPGPAGQVRCEANLYYRSLDELEPAHTEHDAVFPRLERLAGSLAWESRAVDKPGPVEMRISLTLDEVVDAPLGKVWKLDFAPEEALTFRPLHEGGDGGVASHSLSPCGSAAPPGAAYDCRALHVRFVSVSELESAAALEPWAQEWIDSACRVWWAKGGVQIVPYPDIDERHYPTGPGDTPGEIPLGKETGIVSSSTSGGVGQDTARIDIYLADRLDPSRWGGVTLAAGTDQAYILLEIEQAKHSKFLLAHELGHVLGLAHPDATGAAVWAGSYCSVMLPDKPNSSRNTASNLNVVEGHSPPLAPPVFQTLLQDTDRAADAQQGFFHIIRDLPYDDGAATFVVESPFVDWWSCSDVWNSNQEPEPRPIPDTFDPLHYQDGTDIFRPDHSPIHSEPSCSGPNWMYVRLHTCQPLGGAANPQVAVYLYLAVPGASSEPLTPLLGGTAPSLTFSGISLPTPSFPRTNWVQWNVPAGYPPNCCVFAVAVSDWDPSPLDPALADIIAHPGMNNFYSLFSRLQSDNDVTQRNLHIQGCSPMGGMPFWSALPWLEMANPFDEAAAAHVEIDTTQAPGLRGLSLEVNGESVQDVAIGGSVRVDLAKALSPQDRLIPRLRATLPSGAPLDTTFAIDLRFFVGDELVTGYRHLLRVAPLAETVAQVMDTLFGALRDVQAGSQVDTQELVQAVRQLRGNAAGAPPRVLGDLCARAALFRGLVAHLQAAGVNPQQYQAVYEPLSRLENLLSESADSQSPTLLAAAVSPNVLAERIRDLADRIQEPAGRLARQRQPA